MRVDHVIYATADLDAAAARIEAEIGAVAVPGGRHEGLGTRNQIVPLGDGYLELLAVEDPNEAARSTLGAALTARIAGEGDGLLGWAVAVDDLDTTAERLGTTITTIRREGLSARLAGLAEAMREPFLPFFVQRDPGVADPATGGNAEGVTWIEVGGDAARLRQWLDGAQLPIRIVSQRAGVRAIGIGNRELRTA